jgi:MFS family permease
MEKKKLRQNLAMLITLKFFIAFNLVHVIQALFFQSNGVDFTQIGIILAMTELSTIIFEVPTGLIADKFGNKISVILSCVFMAGSFAIALTFRTFLGFCVSLFVCGIGYTMQSGALETLIIEKVRKHGGFSLAKINALLRVSFYASIALASVLSGFLSEHFGFESAFYVSIAAQLISILLLLLVKTNSVGTSEKLVGGLSEATNVNSASKVSLKNVLKYLSKNPLYIHLLAIQVFIALCMIPVESYYANFTTSKGVSLEITGIALGAQYLFSAIVALLALKKFQKLLPKKTIITVFPIFGILCVLVFAISPNIYLGMAVYVISVLSYSLSTPTIWEEINQDFESKFRTTSVSLQSFASGIVVLIAQPVFGKMADLFGMEVGFVCLLLVSAVLLLINNMFIVKHLKTQ